MKTSNPYKDERTLIDACAHNAPGAREQFVEQYDRLLRAVIARVQTQVGQPAGDVEDILHQVYVKLLDQKCRRMSGWRGQSRFSTYLAQIAKNIAVDHGRRQGRMHAMTQSNDLPPWLDAEVVPKMEDSDQVLLDALRGAIDKLSPKQRLIMKLRMQGKTLRDIAEILETPEGTVFSDSARAMKQLRGTMRRMRQTIEGPRARKGD